MLKPASTRLAVAGLLVLAFSLPVTAQTSEPIDEEANTSIRKHGLENSQVMDILSWICDVHGPRLTGSPNLRRAQDWALATFRKWGLKNAHLEEWGPFGRGWRLDHFSMEVVGENPWPIHAWPKAWSPGLPKQVVGEVVYVAEKTVDEIKALDLKGKIVLMQTMRDVKEPFEADAERHDPTSLIALADGTRSSRRGSRRGRGQFDRSAFMQRRARMALVYAQQPLAILDRSSKGDYGTIFVSGASVPSSPDTPRGERPSARNPKGHKVIPQATLAVEHYNRICRLLAKNLPVRVRIDLKTTFFDDDPMERNVVAEIPGTDPAIGSEIVMLGGHFDSWHSGTGATDNGAGSAVMMEAMRILREVIKTRGKGPRRTIRVALWSGEEQGLLGSRAYVSKHFAERSRGGGRRGGPPSVLKPEHAKLSGYFNLDNGTGRVRGVCWEEAVLCGSGSWPM